MKKPIALALAFMLVFSLAACGGKTASTPSGSRGNSGTAPDASQQGNASEPNKNEIAAQMEAFSGDETVDAAFESTTKIVGVGKPMGWTLAESDATHLYLKPVGDATQEAIDGYAKALWDICKGISSTPLTNASRDEVTFATAKYDDDPFDYFYWYYTVGGEDYRINIFWDADQSELEIQVEP